jgi:hypothetical protein
MDSETLYVLNSETLDVLNWTFLPVTISKHPRIIIEIKLQNSRDPHLMYSTSSGLALDTAIVLRYA